MAVSLTGRFFSEGRRGDRLVVLTILLRCLNDFVAGAGAQRLQLFKRKVFSNEAYRAIREGEVGAARMPAAECAGPILDGGKIPARRHSVIDRRGELSATFPTAPALATYAHLPQVSICDDPAQTTGWRRSYSGSRWKRSPKSNV